jgi:hypothetical protein
MPLPILLLQEVSNYALPAVVLISTLIGVATAIATFFVSRTIYRTTLPTRLAETLRANYDAEKARADLAEQERNKLREEKKVWDAEKASLTAEYSQITQLYGRKSIILERITGIYGNLASVAETGSVQEFLEALAHPLKLAPPEEPGAIHKTKG